MIGTLITAVPLVVTLAAAIYFIRRSFQQHGPVREGFTDSGQTGEWRAQPESGYFSGSSTTGRARTTCRRRRHPDEPGESERRYGKRINTASPAPQDLKNECAVCFENEGNIELSPCSHSNMCIDCVNKIITDLDRSCPFCRQYIQAYAVTES